MSSDLMVQINQSPELDDEQRERVRKLVRNTPSSHLAADQEIGPFMLYVMGQNLESISKSSGYPFDVIALTAVHYKWAEKKTLMNSSGENVAVQMQKQIVNMMLVASFMAARDEMAKLLSGRVEASKSPIAVKSLSGLTSLMEMVMKLNGMTDAKGNPVIPVPGGTVIHANNVQINNGKELTEEEQKRLEEKKKSRTEMLKELANEQDGV